MLGRLVLFKYYTAFLLNSRQFRSLVLSTLNAFYVALGIVRLVTIRIVRAIDLKLKSILVIVLVTETVGVTTLSSCLSL